MTWSETGGDHSHGTVGIRAVYNDNETVVKIEITEGDAGSNVGIAIGSEVAEIVAAALAGTSEFASVQASRSYGADYATYS